MEEVARNLLTLAENGCIIEIEGSMLRHERYGKGCRSMKKILLIILGLIICIPTVVAIASYQATESANPNAKTVASMTLTDPEGHTSTFSDEDGDEATKMIELFVDLMDSASKVSSLPAQLDGRHYTVTMSSKPNTSYQFYFTNNPEVCYYTDATSIYKLNAAKAGKFLSTSYAAGLYKTSELPSLSLSGQNTVPTEAEWYYKTYDGSFVKLDTDGLLALEPPTLSLEGGLGIAFDSEPDDCDVKIARQAGGEIIFDGKLEELSSLNLSTAGTVSVSITASWDRSDDVPSYGSITYTFFANVTAPAEFYLKASANNQAGDLITITAYNIADVSKIQFSSTLASDFTPRFFAVEGEDYAVALFAVPLDTKAGNYTMTLAYGGVQSDLTLKVTARSIKNSNLVVSKAVYDTFYKDSVKNDFHAELEPYLAYAAATQYWSGDFAKIFPDSDIKSGYAKTRPIYKASEKTKDSFTQETVVYKANTGTAITATASGEVIFAGYLEFGGNMVIIEHGYGLKSWYMHLDSVSVRSGETVAKGAEVGKAGKSGFFTSEYTGVEFAMSVFEQFFCPYDLWSDGELKGVSFKTK